MFKGLVILFLFLLLGEGISLLLELPIPGNVIGMVLLTCSLQMRWIKLEDVKPAADGLLETIALLFVPPGVGLMLYFELIKQEWLVIIIANLVSTIAVLVVVGTLQQKLENHKGT